MKNPSSPGSALLTGGRSSSLTVFALALLLLGVALAEESYQYSAGDIKIPRAKADEPVREVFSLTAAADYIDRGAAAWSEARKCVSCHTNGSYLLARPSLSPVLGAPPASMRAFFVSELKESQEKRRREATRRIGAHPDGLHRRRTGRVG